MNEQFTRSIPLIGEDGLEKLFSAKVAIFGVGGVGGYVAEALARAGVGEIILFDPDTVGITNLNRQIIALHSTVGKLKTEVLKDRILDINPSAKVTANTVFYDATNADDFPLTDYDYVIDAIDSVASKLILISNAVKTNTKIISAMGAGNKLDPTRFKVADISKSHECPLAAVVRKKLRRMGINHLKVVFSDEPVVEPTLGENGRPIPSSISFAPAAAGILISSEVIKDLLI